MLKIFLFSFVILFFTFSRDFMAFSKDSKEETFESSKTQQVKNQKEASKSQGVVSKLEKERQNLLDTYKRTLIETENLLLYNSQLREHIVSQEEEIVSMEEQIESLKQTQSGIVPLMIRMIENIDSFIHLDVPFLIEERKKRVQELKAIINSAKFSYSEKFRKIMEAYQEENEYARTLEAYKGSLQIEGEKFIVDFLRLGRVVFVYQTLDGKKRGLWDQKLKKWVPLKGRGYKDALTQAIRVARNQRAPDILKFPIPAPTLKDGKLN